MKTINELRDLLFNVDESLTNLEKVQRNVRRLRLLLYVAAAIAFINMLITAGILIAEVVK